MPWSTCVDVLLKDEKLSYKSKNRRVPVFCVCIDYVRGDNLFY